MKRVLLYISVCVISFATYAQNDSITVYAHIKDAFTGAIIEDGDADVVMPDSSFVSRCKWGYNIENDVRTASLILAQVPKEGKYILRITHPDYFTVYHPIDILLPKRNEHFFVIPEQIGMRRCPKVTQMDQLVVKATKIKMVMRKDTIVYDADAFQLSHGSMLDALIEQLPGAELNDGGIITVNGRQISSLLLNGKDFFKGSPQIALKNLPAYMVDKVKVYEQQTDLEKMTGQDETYRPLVMDINLKHQYSIGWIANAEAAYGTEQKYLWRVFALRFTDCSRLTLFGNINNTNDTRRPGQKGDWTPSYLPDGILTSVSGGAEYFYENRMKTFEWTSNINALCTDNNIQRHTFGESFFPDGKAYMQSRSDDTYKTTRINTSHRFKSQKKERHTGSINFSYDKNRSTLLFLSGEFGEDPYSYVTDGVLDSLFRPDTGKLKQLARYRKREEAYSRGENWNLNAPYSLWWMPFKDKGVNDMLFFDLAGSYDRHTSLAFDNYHLEYLATDALPADYRNRHTTRPSHHYNYNTRLAYAMFFRAVWPTLTYKYSQDYTNGRRDLYRLDRIDGWDEDTEHILGTLPSADMEMQQALDIENSEHSQVWKRRHEVEVKLEYRRRKTKHQTTVVLTMPVRFEQDRLVYDRSGRHYDLHRSKTLFSPN
ncbi:MAG: hypothetical protein K2J00_00205 [Bacteroidaceae bacterium]|nr:hypothetical protein [Bacteroidaceae bacterium]